MLLVFGVIINIVVIAQATTAYQSYLKSEAKKGIYRHLYYIKSFNNEGKIAVPEIEKKVLEVSDYASSKTKLWYRKPFYVQTNNESEAQLIIAASYQINETITEDDKKVYKREMPYTVYFKKHTSSAKVIVHYNYTDGSPSIIDTIKIEHVSKELPWKSFKKPSELELKTKNSLEHAIPKGSVPMETKEVRIIFPKVKIKDKILKEEYAGIQKLLKDNKFVEAGQLCKKVYESRKSPEASAALGLCYELVGNYPKAEEYIKPLKDFHMLSRIRKNMKLVKFAKSIGYEPEFIEF